MKHFTLLFILVYNYSFCQEGKMCINFDSKPNIDASFTYKNGIEVTKTSLVVLFYDDEEEYIDFIPNQIPSNIILKPEQRYVILRHYLNDIDYNDYLLQKGDSILINYTNDKQPSIINLKSKVFKSEYKFEDMVQKQSNYKKYTPIGRYLDAAILYGRRISCDKKILSEFKKLSPEQALNRTNAGIIKMKIDVKGDLDNYLVRYKTILDSLYNLNEVSNIAHDFYNRKMLIVKSLSDIETNKIDESRVKYMITNYHVLSLNYHDVYFKLILRAISDKYISPKAKYLELKDGRNRDSKEIYELTKQSSILTESAKAILLTREINRIGAYYSKKDFISYFKLFEHDVKDSSLVNQMRDRYALEFDDSRNETKSLVMLDNAKKKLSFKQILKSHKGKVVYVDFWASWCAPCRVAMPQSAKLREELKNKDVVFIYLSIDKVFEAWCKAADKEGLSALPNNFLILNADANEFIKQQNITSIPRYMIFDKMGKLAHANAPSVENKDLVNLLISMIK